ncbi:MAG: hypothetical protein ACE5OP_05020 [Candidatus Glassbacteria bacterium]
MEWALFIKRPEEFKCIDEHFSTWQKVDHPDTGFPYPVSEVSFSRTYFGNEFCERTIPSLNELENCLFTSLERGLSFTFVTPHVTDQYIEALSSCFDLLAHDAEGTEVVVNDWGVLRLLRKNHIELTPVLGRILNRSHRGFERSNASNLTYFPYRRFLSNYGVRRVEFDCPIQVTRIGLEKTGLSGSLYLPFDCCVTGGAHLTGESSMQKAEHVRRCEECYRQCQDLARELSSTATYEEKVVSMASGRDNFIPRTIATVLMEKKLESIPDSTIDRLICQSSATV